MVGFLWPRMNRNRLRSVVSDSVLKTQFYDFLGEDGSEMAELETQMEDFEMNELYANGVGDDVRVPMIQEEKSDQHVVGSPDSPNEPLLIENDEIVQASNIQKTYMLGIEGVAALRGVSLVVKRGEFVCICGTSGGGKTR